jgi:hypothetical protein
MNKTWIPFFRTGKHKDSKGRESVWTSAQIDSAVTHFNTLSEDEKQKRPLTISHPENNLPVMGFVEKLQRIGDTLYALPGEVADGFKTLVNTGALPERSISFFSDGTVNHFGFLPVGQKAAIPDLGTFNFSEEDTMQVYNFSEGEVAELPTDEDLQNDIAKLTLEIEKMKADSGSDITVLESAQNKIKELQLEVANNKVKLGQIQFSSQLNDKLTPAQRAIFLNLYSVIASKASDKFEFSDGSSDTPESLLLQLSSQFSNNLCFSEFAVKPKQPPANNQSESSALAEEIRKGMS